MPCMTKGQSKTTLAARMDCHSVIKCLDQDYLKVSPQPIIERGREKEKREELETVYCIEKKRGQNVTHKIYILPFLIAVYLATGAQ